MNRTIDKLKLLFLGIFLLGAIGSWAYQVFWIWPSRECEANGAWWDPGTRICATPIYIPNVTGRPEGVSRREWSEMKAKEAVEKGL